MVEPDLQNAFDTDEHSIVYIKLQTMGIQTNEMYLTERKQKLNANGFKSYSHFFFYNK